MGMTARQNDPEIVREEGINVLLEQFLRGHGLTARAERRSRRGAPDVLVELRSGDLVILECKWEGSASLLESQLDERLKDFPEALGMVGVLYLDGLRYKGPSPWSYLGHRRGVWRMAILAQGFAGGPCRRAAAGVPISHGPKPAGPGQCAGSAAAYLAGPRGPTVESFGGKVTRVTLPCICVSLDQAGEPARGRLRGRAQGQRAGSPARREARGDGLGVQLLQVALPVEGGHPEALRGRPLGPVAQARRL